MVITRDLPPGRLGMASGQMVDLAIDTGGLGVTPVRNVADAWAVPANLPIVGLILCFFLSSSNFPLPAGGKELLTERILNLS